MRRAQDVGIGRIGLFRAHLVVEAVGDQVLRHLGTPTQLVDEALVQPGLVDAQLGVGEQTVTVEALDVIALVGAAVAPDVDVVLAHRHHQRSAGHGAAQRRGVEVGGTGGRDVEGAALDRSNAFGHQLGPAIDQPRLLGAIRQRLARNLVVIAFVRLAQIRRVGTGNRPFGTHPVHGSAGVQPPGKSNADAFASGKLLQDGRGHR